jgi:hypothetical protein
VFCSAVVAAVPPAAAAAAVAAAVAAAGVAAAAVAPVSACAFLVMRVSVSSRSKQYKESAHDVNTCGDRCRVTVT